MMQILLNRFTTDSDSTISQIYVDGEFVCFGLEDEHRVNKVVGETRIPEGVYDIGMRYVGGFHNRYNKRFPSMHLGMLQVLNVPGFEYILIHVGNTDEDTSGCILVGAGCDATKDDMSLLRSVDAYKLLYSKVIKAATAKELTIRIIG